MQQNATYGKRHMAARYHGLIDFSILGPAPAVRLAVEALDEWRCVRWPGLELRWNAGAASVAQSRGVLALAAGRTRDSSTAGSCEAAHWIDRYLRCGDRAAEDVGGGFAAMLLDFQKRQAMLFVDRFSIQTMCYLGANGRLGFSDSACDVPGTRRELNAQSLYDYLYFHVIPAPQTVFCDVLRVEPAHCVTASATSVHSRTYWVPAFVESDRSNLPGRLRQFIQLVENCVAEEADEPATACFLSGGTDSSTIAGMLMRLRGGPTHAYSIGFKADGYDEMAYARVAARHFGLVHHEYYITPDDLVSAIPQVAWSFDQPFGNSSVLPAYYCALRAKEDGFGRLLAGDGGDELFGGNSRYALQKVFNLYHALPRTLRGAILEPVAIHSRIFRNVPGLKQLGGYIRHSHVPMPDRFETFNLLHRLGEDTLLEPAFRASIDPERSREQQRATWRASDARSLVNRMLAYDWKYTLADCDLPKVRGASQLAGVSVGYPLLGRALTDFSLSLPPEWKVKGLKLRWFFKEALRDFLPREILGKKKHGFGLPFGHWVLRHPGLEHLVKESLEGIAGRGIVRSQFTSELLTTRLPEAPGYYGELAWILMMLEQWLRANEARQFAPSKHARPG